jgi:hypothetical protein
MWTRAIEAYGAAADSATPAPRSFAPKPPACARNQLRNPLNPNPKPRNWLRSVKKLIPPSSPLQPTHPPPSHTRFQRNLLAHQQRH